ncbi:class I SAM-dependent methyltransferase [Edaphobacter modestus]|uniref:Methyltransferase family protein n=1 Tax=Edaphobacter modestus TaxID=388466 RepID=A0A4Q7YW73_9BACT|nr:class I SAM-dependent methyltransferase [Edaphobacter modestus]RZU41634.1 methyltransferase family protein [Edaphobacter modestus]
MTEWNAPEYARISALQQAMAAEVLSLLDLGDAKSVLDLGCGNGKVTAEIAARLPEGRIVGVDASADMIAFATDHFGPATHPNLRFAVSDIRRIGYEDEFDLIVSFNALHWIPEQAKALRAIRGAMKTGASAQLRLVPKGERKSLEDVLEETRKSQRWASYYDGYQDPYLQLTAAEYAELAEGNGLHVVSMDVKDKSWNFGSRAGFFAFGSVTFIEWTRRLPEEAKPEFIRDVLDRYSVVAGDEKTFRFYQMDIRLAKDDAL